MNTGSRHPIWSVSEDDQEWFAVLFPVLWLSGTVYYALLMVSWEDVPVAIGKMIVSIGGIGLSAAVLSLMVIAGKGLVMVLFDWANKAREKSRQKGREEAFDQIRNATPPERLAEINSIIEKTQRIIEEGESRRQRSND